MHMGADKMIFLAHLCAEFSRIAPRPEQPLLVSCYALTDCMSVITYLGGSRAAGREKALIGYLAAVRWMLDHYELKAAAHVVTSLMLADPLTKDMDCSIVLNFLRSGGFCLEHAKQDWTGYIEGDRLRRFREQQ